MTHVPTLLIGLGGIGSRIVDEVYHRIPHERRDKIAVHAFDTNINDISHLRYLTADQITQTSTSQRVDQYLYQAAGAVDDWFPTGVHELGRKLLTEGAGQIRTVSRLAYRASMEEGKLHKLRSQIRSVFRASGDDLITSVRVMIVCTLAGGTGAGIFLQTALYVRELLDEAFGKNSVLVRGAFILPDVLTHTDILDQREWPNVRANGYASIKELDALTDNAVGAGPNGGVTIELEYRPGGDPVLSRRHLPYDFCFLYDFENTRGENLDAFPNYIEQVVQSIYLQLFTPISAESFSVEDNQIRSTIAAGGKNRYCGAGVARLIYPYDDIIRYCALRWGTNSLSDQWLKLDADYEEEFRQYERDLQGGIFREKPSLDERYVKLLNQYGSGEQPDPFFRLLHRSAHRIDEKQNLGAAKADLFVEAVRERIERVLEGDQDLEQAEVDAVIDEGRLRDRENAKREVIRVEDTLLFLQREIQKAVYEYKVALVNEVVAQDCDRPTQAQGEPHHLNTWMLAADEPLHPVIVRYVLYQILQRLDVEVRELTTENEATLSKIKAYNEAYDDPETMDFVENPEDRLRSALQQSIFGRVFQNEFKDFVEEYVEKANRQRAALIRYKKSKLTELVFSDVRQAVRAMLDEWELFFKNLRDTRNRLSEELIRTSTAHEKTLDPTKVYVLASKVMKEALWEDVRVQLVRNDLPVDISKQLYLGQYRRFCQRHRRERVRDQSARSTEALFREQVLGWCETTVRQFESLDLNVVEALRQEADFETPSGQELDSDQYLSDRIRRVENLAHPFVPAPADAATIQYWGMHPDTVKSLSEQQFQRWFGEAGIVEAAFLRQEILRYRAVYGLEAEDLAKFSAGDGDSASSGAYFEAYDVLRKQLISDPERAVTPHLDDRWHLPAYMKDIGEAVQIKNEREIQDAFLLGLIYGLLRPAKRDQQEVWTYVSHARGRPLRMGDKAVPARLYQLLGALTHEPGIVDHVLEDAITMRREDFERYQKSDTPRFHRFYQGAVTLEPVTEITNILDAVLRLPEGMHASETLRQQSYQLLQRLLDLIREYYLAYYGASQPGTAGRYAALLVEKLVAESKALQSAEKDSEVYARWHAILNAYLAQFQKPS